MTFGDFARRWIATSPAARVSVKTLEGYSDILRVQLDVEDGRVAGVAFTGSGCAISTASASLMTQAIKGRPVPEVERLFGSFHALVTAPPGEAAPSEGLGKLEVFSGVREFPVRVKCATLAWHTLRAALAQSGETAKTE